MRTRTPTTAEIVTFRAAPGIAEEAMAAAAAALGPFLGTQPGFVARRLSVDGEGIWTDHIVWETPEAARAAAEALMQEPAAAPFLAAIAPGSARMTHAPVLVSQER